ncbi:MAG: hypothetical protein GC180_10190 [Bacteroidetes bacterium]|nr:hypothetical protein [Bacteroidota bacterium]
MAKLSDADSEAGETQIWLEFSNKCGHLNLEKYYYLKGQ